MEMNTDGASITKLMVLYNPVLPVVRGWVDMGAPLSSNVMEPVGFGAVELVTVAVNVTGEPVAALAMRLSVRVTTVGAGLMVKTAEIGARA